MQHCVCIESASEAQHVKIIRKQYMYLLQTLDAGDAQLIALLRSRDVLNDNKRRNCLFETYPTKQCGKLLSIICRKSARQFDDFLKCLKEANQGHVADVLRGAARKYDSSNLGLHCRVDTVRIYN
jgi:hypothetical protein